MVHLHVKCAICICAKMKDTTELLPGIRNDIEFDGESQVRAGGFPALGFKRSHR